MNRPLVYLTGPIYMGDPQDIQMKFKIAKTHLRSNGFEVLDRYMLQIPRGNEYSKKGMMDDARRKDTVAMVQKSNIVALMPYWNQSSKAMLEIATAILSGKTIMDAHSFKELTFQVPPVWAVSEGEQIEAARFSLI